jgi:hypothetical protein
MKSGRLESTTDRYARPALERSPDVGELESRVEALNAIEGDRSASAGNRPPQDGPWRYRWLLDAELRAGAGLPPEKRALGQAGLLCRR